MMDSYTLMWMHDAQKKFVLKSEKKNHYKENDPLLWAERKGYVCAACGKVDHKIDICSCQKVYYCNKRCQKRH